MATIEKRPGTAREAIDYLRELALDQHRDFYFRGHSNELWDLGSTYARHRTVPRLIQS